MKRLIYFFLQVLDDITLGVMFYQTMRRIRKQHPEKNFLSRLNYACEAIQHVTVKSQIEIAVRNTKRRQAEKTDA